jgi:phosphopantothenoylcysteine decarboxylase/phosphopantothenate--cysteine ligase
VYFAPAMDLDMYIHPSTINTSHHLKFGNTIIPAESGELASGLSGQGRMAEPENILASRRFREQITAKRKKILITAGPNKAIDRVL